MATNQRKHRRAKMMQGRVDEAQRTAATERAAAIEATTKVKAVVSRLDELEAIAIEHAKFTEKFAWSKSQITELEARVDVGVTALAEAEKRFDDLAVATTKTAEGLESALASIESELADAKVKLAKAEESAKTKELQKARRRLHERTEELSACRTENGKLKQQLKEL